MTKFAMARKSSDPELWEADCTSCGSLNEVEGDPDDESSESWECVECGTEFDVEYPEGIQRGLSSDA